MEQVIGKGVIHKIFGRGVIVLSEERYLTIRFEDADALQEKAREAAAQAAADRQKCSAKIAIRCKESKSLSVFCYPRRFF